MQCQMVRLDRTCIRILYINNDRIIWKNHCTQEVIYMQKAICMKKAIHMQKVILHAGNNLHVESNLHVGNNLRAV